MNNKPPYELVLKAYPYPMTSTLCQFGAGAVFVLAMWASGAHKPPKDVNAKMLLPILPLAVVHTLGGGLYTCEFNPELESAWFGDTTLES